MTEMCKKHPNWPIDECVWCGHKASTPHIATEEWIRQGTWEHIDPKNPNLKFNSKAELIAACDKFGVMPRAFMKPKSQGRGYETQRRTR